MIVKLRSFGGYLWSLKIMFLKNSFSWRFWPRRTSLIVSPYWVFSRSGNAQSKNASLGSGETRFYSIVFQHFWGSRTIGSMKFSPATEFWRKKIALNPECKIVYTWWSKNISHRFSLRKIRLKMDNILRWVIKVRSFEGKIDLRLKT